MARPATRLFHLHFNTPDVPGTERRLADFGLPLYRRFGRVDGESRAFDAGDEIPDDFQLRLQNAQRGSVNVTLAPGTRPRFDHLGLRTDSFDAVCDRAEDAGWSVRNRHDGRRTFVTTPWRFRVELHPEGNDVTADLGSWETAHFERATLAVADHDAVRREFEAVFGDVPGLRFADGESDASVPSFVVAGDAFPEGTADVDALLVGNESA